MKTSLQDYSIVRTFLLTCIALSISTSLASAEEFSAKTVVTHGAGGAPRSHEFIAGDRVCLTTVVHGLTLGSDGATDIRVELAIENSDGEAIATAPAIPFCVRLGTGEGTAALRSFAKLSRNATSGKYKTRIAIREVSSRKESVEEIEIELLDSTTFGAINVFLAHDTKGDVPAGYTYTVGDNLILIYGISGHSVSNGAMKVRVKANVVDENHTPLSETYTQVATEKSEPGQIVRGNFRHFANRAGNFKMHLELEDLHSKKTASYFVPFTVIDPLTTPTEFTAERESAPAPKR